MTDALASPAVRLAVVALVELAIVSFLALRFESRRADYIALVCLCLGGGAALALIQPIVAVGDYTDYNYYLHSLGVLDSMMPPRPLFVWVLRGARGIHALWWLGGMIAAALPPLSYLVALALGATRRAAVVSGVALSLSAPFLVTAVDANPVTSFAWAAVVAALCAEAFLRAPRTAGGRLAFGLGAAATALAFVCREEAVFLTAALSLSLLATDRLSRTEKLAALLAWSGLLGALHAGLFASDPRPYTYMLERFDRYSQRVAHQLWLFLGTNAVGIALPLVLWNQRGRRLVPALTSPLLLPVLVYTLVYINGSAAQEHQIVILPLLVPHTVLALSALRETRPRPSSALAAIFGVWVVGSAIGLAVLSLRAPKQAEYADLARGAPPGSVVHFAPYPAYEGDPASPLLALLDDAVRIEELSPPPGCPPTLFAALAAMHERCVANHGPLEDCRRVLRQAGTDWIDQALALGRLQAIDRRRWPRSSSKWYRAAGAAMRGTRASSSRAGSAADPGGDYLFVPFWTRPDAVSDVPEAKFTTFRWLEALRLAIDVPVPEVATPPRALTRVRLRGAAEGASQCEALRRRSSGALLFDLLERAAARAVPR